MFHQSNVLLSHLDKLKLFDNLKKWFVSAYHWTFLSHTFGRV